MPISFPPVATASVSELRPTASSRPAARARSAEYRAYQSALKRLSAAPDVFALHSRFWRDLKTRPPGDPRIAQDEAALRRAWAAVEPLTRQVNHLAFLAGLTPYDTAYKDQHFLEGADADWPDKGPQFTGPFVGQWQCGPTDMLMIARTLHLAQGRGLSDARFEQFIHDAGGLHPGWGGPPEKIRKIGTALGLSTAMHDPDPKPGADLAWINGQLEQKHFVVVMGNPFAIAPHRQMKLKAPGGHYMLIIGRDPISGSYLVNDPADPRVKEVPPWQLQQSLSTRLDMKGNLAPVAQLAFGPPVDGFESP